MGLVHRVGMAVELATNRHGRRAEVSRELFFRAARRFTPLLAAQTSYGVMYVPTNDLYVGAQLFVKRGADADAIGEILGVIERETGRSRRRLMVEIGANIGSTTVPALTRFGFDSVVAIEPLPANVDLLKQNLSANGLEDRATVLPIGLTDADGTMALQVAPENSGDNRLVNEAAVSSRGEFAEDQRTTVEVVVRSWDSLAGEGGFALDDVDLVWIDVQGHEGQVLAGASTLLERRLPVVMEFWPYGLRRSGGLELVERLASEHYERVVDMHSLEDDVAPEVVPASEIRRIAQRIRGIEHTDLVLLPS